MRNIWMVGAALSLVGWTGAAQAQQFAEANFNTITVTATRTEQSVDRVPATVSVITADEIEKSLAADIKDLIRFEPGVSVQTQPARFNAAGSGTGRTGNSGFNIRGLDGNRVLIVVDGVRVPDAYTFSAVTFGRGEFVDLDLLQSVEILRGPASALYGSDGLAGAVSFTTRDPAGFLDDEPFGARVRVGYNSADDSWNESLIGAARAGEWSGLIGYTRRDGHETENQGANESLGSARTAANPQDWSSNAALGRVVFEPSEAHRFRLTAEYFDRETTSDIFSSRGTSLGVTTTAVLTDDTSERTRVSFDHTYDNEGGGFIDRASWSIYYQASEGFQHTFEDRFTPPSTPNDRFRASTFVNDVWGGGFQLESAFGSGAIRHRLTYGADYSTTRQEGLRDGAPDTSTDDFPVRPFPNTDYSLAGVFIQDEISIADGQLLLYPAVRYDSYELDPEDDPLYRATPQGQSDSHVTPKFGIVVWPIETFGAYFSYAAGFKAPAPGQVNEFFENLAGPFAFYTVLPNPELRPETSDSVELGVRLRDVSFAGATWHASFAAYSGWYEDFIERTVVGGSGASAVDPTRFQYVNLSNVEISGLEGRVEAAWDNGIGFIVAASASEGEYEEGALKGPLDSVDPLKVVAGLTYDDEAGRWGGQLVATHAGEKKAEDIDSGGFPTDAFTVLDLTAYWNVAEAAAIRAGVFNITDETYTWWSDVRGLSIAPTIRDAFTQPGRNYSVSLSYRF